MTTSPNLAGRGTGIPHEASAAADRLAPGIHDRFSDARRHALRAALPRLRGPDLAHALRELELLNLVHQRRQARAHQQRLADIARAHRQQLVEIDRQRRQRADLEDAAWAHLDQLDHGTLSTWRTLGVSPPPDVLARRRRCVAEELGDGSARRLAGRVEQMARDLGVVLEWAHYRGGMAWPTRKIARVPRLQTERSIAVALHEIGHTQRPCRPTHTRVLSSGGTGCVACELEAWRWAIEHAPDGWTRAMHQALGDALSTYKPYATAAEACRIDELSSRQGYRQAVVWSIQAGH